MVTSINSSTSALQALSKKMQVSANNVANLYSDDFKKSRALLTEGQNGQVDVDISTVDTPGPLVDDPLSPTGGLKELSNTDLAEEFSQQIITKNNFAANAKTIQTYDDMLGTVIDILE
jgi:flagellar basal-body rod protein FlgC